MAILTDEEQLNTVLELYYHRYNTYNEKVLQELGKTVKEIGELKPSEVYQLSQKIKYSENIDNLIQELADITDKSTGEIEELFKKFAKENEEFSEAYSEAKESTGYNNNVRLQRIVNSISNNTKNSMINLSNTRATGFVYKNSYGTTSFKGLKETYYNLVDEAVYNVATGTKDYHSAMRSILNGLADSGIRVHQDKIGYESGYSRRLDTAIRQNVLEGLREVNVETQKQIGDQIGADGVEISVHFPCAFDHLPVQGRQYSIDEYNKMNDSLDRPIGMYNCRHFIMQIVLGVDKPMYSEHTLWELEQKSYETFEYDGKQYTPYEATQMQRKLETEIRRQKDRQIIAKAAGDLEGISKAQQKISALTSKYNDFSSTAGLSTYKDRLTVSGYRRVNVSKYASSSSTNTPLSSWRSKINNTTDRERSSSMYKAMLKDYDKWYNSLDKKELVKLENKLQEHYTKDYHGVKESNPLGEFINKELGYDKLPELIDKKQLKDNAWYRGMGTHNVQEHIKEFKTGKFFAGEGYEANGTYVSSNFDEAFAYSGKNEKNIIYLQPKDNVRIVDISRIRELGNGISSEIDYNKYMNEDGELYVNITDAIMKDPGYVASLLGYDVVVFDMFGEAKNDARKLILNRGAIKVVK